MRLAKHSLPKSVNKQVRTAKHKDSLKRQEKDKKKQDKQNEMEVASQVSATTLSAKEKEELKAARKKATFESRLYKKQILSFSGKNGPRAINKVAF